MSPVIAFDIAVVAQKVKVQCYIMADMLNLKKWVGCWWITSRSGWLLELLTELTKDGCGVAGDYLGSYLMKT